LSIPSNDYNNGYKMTKLPLPVHLYKENASLKERVQCTSNYKYCRINSRDRQKQTNNQTDEMEHNALLSNSSDYEATDTGEYTPP